MVVLVLVMVMKILADVVGVGEVVAAAVVVVVKVGETVSAACKKVELIKQKETKKNEYVFLCFS